MEKQAVKTRFYNLCVTYDLDLDDIAQHAGVSYFVVRCMYIDTPVLKDDAVKVLQAVEAMTEYPCYLQNVEVPLLATLQLRPTFAQLMQTYGYDERHLMQMSQRFGVSFQVLRCMYEGEHVLRGIAAKAMREFSWLVNDIWTLETTRIAVK